MSEAHTAPGVQRVVAFVVLVAAGIISLPLAALVLDGEGTENFILPAQLAGMAIVGAIVGRLLPGLAGPTASTGRAVWVGVGVGLLVAVLSVLLFFVLITG